MRYVALVLAAFLAGASPIQAADLSPAHWPQAQRASLEARETTLWPNAASEVRGRVLVTGSASPVAIHAGREALRQGGSAADAATVVAFTQIARTMGQTVSYAGKMAIAYYDAKSRKLAFLDSVSKLNPDLGGLFVELYQQAIDFGAHLRRSHVCRPTHQ